MGDRSFDWNSFWDVATPQRAADLLRSNFGDAAIGAATQCALAAQADQRPEDAAFWRAVVAHLGGGDRGSRVAPVAPA